MKTRQEINAECNKGSYGSGLDVIVMTLVFGGLLTLVLRFIC